MRLTISAGLIAFVGVVAVVSGLLLLLWPRRAAGTLGVTLADATTENYARFSGVRNAAMGALLLGVAIVAWRTGALNRADAGGLAFAWAVVQGTDSIIFVRVGSRSGMITAAALALLSLTAGALAWAG
ncbi:MAG TPA: DUF4267 domain-containing protein [Ktedonobacterales bacterium]